MQWSITRRPQKLSELYGLTNIKTYFYEKAKSKEWPKSILLRGQFGNGKTTAAQIVAQMMTCQNPAKNGDPCGECPECRSIIEGRFDSAVQMLDGGQAGKADVIDIVSDFAYGTSFYPRRVMIIEEVQELSTAAKNSLLKILENPRDKIHFILLSMENGGASGFASRCVPFNFKKIPVKELMLFLKQTLEAEELWKDENIPDEFKTRGLATIAQVAQGSIRQALQLLETCVIGKYFTAQEIVDNLGIADESMVIDVLLDLMDADPNVWIKLDKFEPFDFFALGYKIVADTAIYRSCGHLANEGNQFFVHNTKMLASKPAFPALSSIRGARAPNSKPFLRKSEMYVALLKAFESAKAGGARLSEGVVAAKQFIANVGGSGTTAPVSSDTPNNCTDAIPTRSVPVRTRG